MPFAPRPFRLRRSRRPRWLLLGRHPRWLLLGRHPRRPAGRRGRRCGPTLRSWRVRGPRRRRSVRVTP